MKNLTPVQRYVAFAGNQAKAAERLGVSPGMIAHLVKGRRRVSVELAIAIHKDTAGAISREALRPDIWGDSEAA